MRADVWTSRIAFPALGASMKFHPITCPGSNPSHYSFQRFSPFSLRLPFNFTARARNTTQNHQFTHFLFFSKKQTSKGKQKNRKITLSNKAGRQKKASAKKKLGVFGEKRKALQKWGNKRRRKWSKSPFGCRTTRRRVLLVEIINVLLRFIASNVSWNAREPNWIRKLTHEEETQAKSHKNLRCPARLPSTSHVLAGIVENVVACVVEKVA